MSKKKTKEEFIKDAREEHGDKYDYSKVEYVNARTKVCIICPEHGEFWQVPSSHLSGRGCPKCSGVYAPTTEEWIASARKVHGDKYDYSNVKYINDRTKVCIICPEHGEFWQTPNNHLAGSDCPKCGIEKVRENLSFSKEEFIKKAREVHGDKYDYSKVKYVNSATKVCIICPEHGEFWQEANSHLQGIGCPTCGGTHLLTTEGWITKARKVHGDKYDYSKVKYVNAKTKVCIICSEHGGFRQIPNDHIQGHGCPICNSSQLEILVHKSLKENNISFIGQYRPKWLGKQSLDFYLPDYNVGIECQGRQHFEAVDYFGGEDGFKQTLGRDKRKKALCEEHGVKLLYFGNVPNYDTFLGEDVHDDVQYLIDYLEEHKKENT